MVAFHFFVVNECWTTYVCSAFQDKQHVFETSGVSFMVVLRLQDNKKLYWN